MQTSPDCFPCFLKQTLLAIEHWNSFAGESLKKRIIRDVLSLMQEADMSKPPAFTTTLIHRAIRESLGADPFKTVKYDSNNTALSLYPKLKDELRNSDDPLLTASRLAIAGNVIDFSIFSSVDMESSVRRALEAAIAVDDYQSFREDIQETEEILFLHDNSGEIVFDRLFIEEIEALGKRVRAVVKGSPVLNDVTYEDAVQTGLSDICDVIDNGSDAIGTILEWTSQEFQREFRAAEVIISKGQANFETLAGTRKKTYFLFQSKCDVVSKALGLMTGSMLFKKS